MKYRFCFWFVAVIFLSCSSPEPPQKQQDFSDLSWPIFRGDAHLSGTARGRLPEKLDLLWSFQTGDAIMSSAVVGLGMVFIGSTDGKLYALNVANGDSLWAVDTGDDIEAPPLLFDSTLYIGNLSGDFFAFDAASADTLWTFAADGEIYGSANIVAAPDGGHWVLVGSYDFKTYCLDAHTGERIWEYEADNYINGAPATDGKVILFGGCDERLHILSVADGKKLAEVVAGSYIAGSAALVDGKAYLGHYGEELMCIEIESHKVLWRYNDDGATGSFFSTPAVDNKHVVIGSRDKRVHCVDRKTGKKKWTFKTRDDVDSSPIICDNKVIVGSIWSYEIGAEITGSPAVADGFIFIGADDGRLYAFGESL